MRLRSFMVYAYVPVNVKVRASSAERAGKLALKALNDTRPLDLQSEDDGVPIYIDEGISAKLDPEVRPAVLEGDKHREHAIEEKKS